MQQEITICLSAENANDEEIIRKECSAILNIPKSAINHIKICKRSIDARNRTIKINITCLVFHSEITDFVFVESSIVRNYKQVESKQTVHIVGAGPAGLFAALRLIELGIKPIIIERGKTVRERRRDLADINKNHHVNPNSNYCFGEGGAGTYSDGKLYTRSTKRGDVIDILQTLVFHGASSDILVEAHPHIGTNNLPKIIEQIRKTILDCGGEFHFNKRLKNFVFSTNNSTANLRNIKGIILEDTITGQDLEQDVQQLILATGHSARDIYHLLNEKNVLLESKPFALGVRVEHPQSLIDDIQYHCLSAEERKMKRNFLPAASYSWVHQVMGRGVYSFCMCPGGIIAPCATEQNQVVTNGWSPSKRNNPYSNSGIVVSVTEKDYAKFSSKGALAGMFFQQQIENNAWILGGKTQTAPAQRLIDFVEKKTSSKLPDCSYIPGVASVDINEVLPSIISQCLREGFEMQAKKMKGYFTNEAIIVATESRTSTPVRIPRNPLNLQHPQIINLFPCGEGAGFAGGIVSAAIDGVKIANAVEISVH